MNTCGVILLSFVIALCCLGCKEEGIVSDDELRTRNKIKKVLQFAEFGFSHADLNRLETSSSDQRARVLYQIFLERRLLTADMDHWNLYQVACNLDGRPYNADVTKLSEGYKVVISDDSEKLTETQVLHPTEP